MSAALPGFLPNHPEHLRLRRSKPHVIPNAEQNCPGPASLLNNQRSTLVFNALKELSEMGAGYERGYNHRLCFIVGS